MTSKMCIKCNIENECIFIGIKPYCTDCFIEQSKTPRVTECSSCNSEDVNCYLKGTKYFCEKCIEYNLHKKNNKYCNYCNYCNRIDNSQLVQCDNGIDYMCLGCGEIQHGVRPCFKCKKYHIDKICEFGPFTNVSNNFCDTCKRYHDSKCAYCSLCMDYVPSDWEHCGKCSDCGPKGRPH